MGRQLGLIAVAVLAVFGLLFVFSSYFTVNQNEATVVTRFGSFEYVADPGLHFKFPFITSTASYRTDI